MIIKGANCVVVKKYLGKSSLLKDESSEELSNLDTSVEIDEKETKQYSIKNRSLNMYLKYILPCDLLRVILSGILFGTLIFFFQQAKYMVIERHEVSILSGILNESIRQQKYVYDSIFEERIVWISTIMGCYNIPKELRFDCHPEDGVSQEACLSRGCCWNPLSKEIPKTRFPVNTPYCYYPKNWTLYKYDNYSQVGNSFTGFLKQTAKSFFKNDLPLVKVEASSVDDSVMRLKMYDPLKKRYEPPWPIRPSPKPVARVNVNEKYRLEVDSAKPGFKVSRAEDGTALFDSIDVGAFIFADQFLQISALLPSHNIYGIGEHRANLKLGTNWQSFTTFNKDQPPTENANLYGAHPFYLVVENSGKAHGVLFLNSNAMDVILQPSPAVTFQTIGGIFDIYFFLGPTPADVIRQYSELVGKPFLPPYWSLGFHLCRYGYGSLENTKEVWNRTIEAGIPLDTQWNDLDYMDKNNDFTYDLEKFKELPQFVDELHSKGMHYIPLIDAGVSGSETKGSYLPYDEGVKQDIFIKDESNQPFVGKVWNFVSTVWPDFSNPKTKDYWYQMMSKMHDSFAYDGAWIDMNEPSNFYNGHKNGCSHNDLDYPPYVPNVDGRLLSTKTLCMNAKQYLGFHYDLHNTYGTSEAIATNYALSKIRNKRPFIISRSTWVGHGHYAGHWTGDVFSTWHDLKMSIPAILSLNFYQIPMVGADICGFNDNTTAALCNRWMQLGSFYPFSRNHNSDDTIEQDPVAMGELVVKSSIRALTVRYWLLPYLYTLFFRAHKFGETVARPLFFEFPNDSATYDIDTQFLWGKSLMIAPVLEDEQVKVDAYLPRGLWYDLYTKASIFATGKKYTLDAPLDTIPLLIRGGSILPAQKPAATTTDSRKNGFELLITLDNDNKAEGELYWDDGDSLDSVTKGDYLWATFVVENNTLTSSKTKESSFSENVMLDKIQIWGVTNVTQVFLNDREIKFEYSDKEHCLCLNDLQTDLRERLKLTWKDSSSN
ncbi:lysosomal alpha-glucosidase [Calliopsis andreniformis]|uniref:lysosomal alpha-glucosidase n=1 Tax=Calliopsis andreniformis TaxID=337506 RepID=UPI003FCE8B53